MIKIWSPLCLFFIILLNSYAIFAQDEERAKEESYTFYSEEAEAAKYNTVMMHFADLGIGFVAQENQNYDVYALVYTISYEQGMRLTQLNKAFNLSFNMRPEVAFYPWLYGSVSAHLNANFFNNSSNADKSKLGLFAGIGYSIAGSTFGINPMHHPMYRAGFIYDIFRLTVEKNLAIGEYKNILNISIKGGVILDW